MTAYPFTKFVKYAYTFLRKGLKGVIKRITFEAWKDAVYNVLLASEINGVRLEDKERSNNGDGFRCGNR